MHADFAGDLGGIVALGIQYVMRHFTVQRAAHFLQGLQALQSIDALQQRAHSITTQPPGDILWCSLFLFESSGGHAKADGLGQHQLVADLQGVFSQDGILTGET